MFGPGLGKGRSSSYSARPKTVREQRKADRNLSSSADFNSLTLDELKDRYPSGLMFYDEPPRCQISLEMMETLAVERLRFLRVMEKHSSMSTAIKYSDEWKNNVNADLKNQGLESYVNVLYAGNKSKEMQVFQNRSRDHFSHFILRLAYSRTEELRRWFINHEVDAFRLKSFNASPDEISMFMNYHDLRFTAVSDEEKAEIKDQLDAVIGATIGGLNRAENTTFYKVHFTEALDLVRKRYVLVKNGFCYVPESEMITLLAWMFKSLLTQNLALTAKTLPNLDEDDRLVRMLGDLDKRYTGTDKFCNGDGQCSVKPEMIKPLSEKSFPLCMKAMQKSLDSTHHLKYKARLQYGLFLKGIGLSMEDAIRFFRGEFTRAHIDPEKFDKEYTYGIRYNYGKEGKKVNWAPWNCMRIIMENVGGGENHGCPYKHHDQDSLKSLLVKAGIEGEELSSILQSAKEGHYQKACSLEFRASHKGQELSTGVVNHPNQYYTESINGGVAPNHSAKGLKTERASLYN